MTILQKPDDLSDEDWEEILEDHAEKHKTDSWDTLEQIRKLLNNSQLEAMSMIKKSSRFGSKCPYYIKSKKIFYRDSAAEILSLLEKFNREKEELNTTTRPTNSPLLDQNK